MDKFTLNQEDSLLIIVDIQERLVPAMEYGESVINCTVRLTQIANELNLPICITEQYPKGLGTTVQEIRDCVGPSKCFSKMTFSAYTKEVAQWLQNMKRKKVIILGMETHVCVFQTVRDLINHGYQVYVVEDAVCSRNINNYYNGLRLMEQMGGIITNSETVLFDLMKTAEHEKFKALSRIIK